MPQDFDTYITGGGDPGLDLEDEPAVCTECDCGECLERDCTCAEQECSGCGCGENSDEEDQ
jgi:hypothetical protein